MLSWFWTQFMIGQASTSWTERACVRMKSADGFHCSLHGGSEELCRSRTVNIDVVDSEAVGY